MKSLTLAYCHTTGSSADFRLTSRTWLESGNSSARRRGSSVTDFRQTEVSRSRHGNELAFTIRGKCDARLEILASQIWKVFENLIFRHIRSQVIENFINRDALSTHARFSASLVRFDRDVVSIIHRVRLRLTDEPVKASTINPEDTARAEHSCDAARAQPW